MSVKRKCEYDNLSAKKVSSSANQQRFKVEYSIEYPCLSPSMEGEFYVYCKYCNVSFKVNYGGINDCTKHMSGKNHKAKAEAMKSQQSILTSFGSSSATIEMHLHNVAVAEMKMADFFVKHNVPLNAADHCGALFKKIFPGL